MYPLYLGSIPLHHLGHLRYITLILIRVMYKYVKLIISIDIEYLDQRFPITFADGALHDMGRLRGFLRKGPLRSFMEFGATGESCPNQHNHIVEKVVLYKNSHGAKSGSRCSEKFKGMKVGSKLRN